MTGAVSLVAYLAAYCRIQLLATARVKQLSVMGTTLLDLKLQTQLNVPKSSSPLNLTLNPKLPKPYTLNPETPHPEPQIPSLILIQSPNPSF